MSRERSQFAIAVMLALVASLGGAIRPPAGTAAVTPFTDIAGTTFEADIEWLWAEGITVGCSPYRYCPDELVSRGEMASFLVRMFELTEGAGIDAFTDDDGTTHEGDINRLAHAGLTKGCTATTFCPTNPIRRDEMASFLARAIPLTDGAGRDYFRDDDGMTHEANIDRAAAAGMASGCYPSYYCPTESVTRGQMAGFLHRVVKRVNPPPYPAPSGPLSLHVETVGVDKGNACFDPAEPCRTIRHALELALDADTIVIGPGTFREEALYVGKDLTITGDQAGGTIIDASGGEWSQIFSVASSTATMSHLTLTGGRNTGAAISCHQESVLLLADMRITGNESHYLGGGIHGWSCDLTIVDSTIHGNSAEYRGGAVESVYGSLTIVGTTIDGNTGGTAAGIGTYGNNLLVVNSTISGNVSTDVKMSGSGDMIGGGGIEGDGGHLTIINSTISGNVAQVGGGGIRLVRGATLDLVNAIVAGNVAPTNPDLYGPASKVASIVGVPSGLTLAEIVDPDGLADNGGPTETIALTDSAKNPAIGKGDAATCAADPVNGVDQRGEPRTPPCDIGAYEVR